MNYNKLSRVQLVMLNVKKDEIIKNLKSELALCEDHDSFEGMTEQIEQETRLRESWQSVAEMRLELLKKQEKYLKKVPVDN